MFQNVFGIEINGVNREKDESICWKQMLLLLTRINHPKT
jgi:hypothetical protein